MKRYLLYTDQQITAYRQKHRDLIAKKATAYAKWVNSLPFWEWTRLILPQGYEEAVIGLLCLLHTKNYINITFSSDCRSIQRNPMTEEEFEAAVNKHTEK